MISSVAYIKRLFSVCIVHTPGFPMDTFYIPIIIPIVFFVVILPLSLWLQYRARQERAARMAALGQGGMMVQIPGQPGQAPFMFQFPMSNMNQTGQPGMQPMFQQNIPMPQQQSPAGVQIPQGQAGTVPLSTFGAPQQGQSDGGVFR